MVLICEYLVTFPDEVNLFWKRRWTGATVLFFMNRYISLSYHIFGIANSALPTIAVRAYFYPSGARLTEALNQRYMLA